MEALELVRSWRFAWLGAALVVVALLVNLFAPARRQRLRSAVVLYLSCVVAFVVARALGHAHSDEVTAWAKHVRVLADLCCALALVRLAGLLVFDVLMPAVGIGVVAITSDLVVGAGYLFAALGVLEASGATPSSVVTTSAVISGVIALSLQTTLGNVLGGVALRLDGSVDVGDWIQLSDGKQGQVKAVRWRHTIVESRDWETIVVPNANLLAQNIVILGKRGGKPRQYRKWVYFNVDFRYAPSQVVDVVRDALCAAPIDGVAQEPPPSVVCLDFAREGRNSFGSYAARYWLTDLANDDPTSSRIRMRIYAALQRAGIPLARPAHTVFMRAEEDDEERAARQKARRLRALEKVDLFQSLTADERAFVAEHLRYAPFAAGETCTRQGAMAHWLYVLTSGKVEVRRHVDDIVKTVATIEAPSFFGEMGLMAGEPRSADVVAVGDVECYRLDKPGLQHILEQRPEVAEQFSRTLAERRVALAAATEDLDEAARRARMATEQVRILDRIQQFFGLERTTH